MASKPIKTLETGNWEFKVVQLVEKNPTPVETKKPSLMPLMMPIWKEKTEHTNPTTKH